ncbi:MAG: hypothetical protein V1721_10025 [Pseudomonadota bacterium]
MKAAEKMYQNDPARRYDELMRLKDKSSEDLLKIAKRESRKFTALISLAGLTGFVSLVVPPLGIVALLLVAAATKTAVNERNTLGDMKILNDTFNEATRSRDSYEMYFGSLSPMRKSMESERKASLKTKFNKLVERVAPKEEKRRKPVPTSWNLLK